MQTSVEPLEGNRVRLTVTVPADEFEQSIDAAYRRFAQQVRIPGFRPGKAPRRILEQSIPVAEARAQALKDSLPDYYVEAVGAETLDVIAAPTLDITDGEAGGDVTFTAEVEVRPEVRLTGYDELRVVVDLESATDERVSEQIDAMRERFATLEDSESALTVGDFARIDIAAYDGDDEIPGLSASDFTYEVGSGILVDELDEAIRGTRPGATLEFTATLPERFGERAGDEVTFRGEVKAAQQKVLPELTDEWVDEHTESETVDALRAEMATRIELVGRVQAQMSLRDKVLEAVAEIVPVEAPAPLVEREMERRLHDLAHRLEHQGMTIPQYLMAIGQDQESFVAEVREGSTKAVLVDLGLRSVASAEALEATDEEVEAEVERIVAEAKGSSKKLRRQLEQQGIIDAVRFDIARGKALQFLVDHAQVVDQAGNPVDLTLPEPAGPADDSNDTPDTPDTPVEEQA
jgi:trigger factor